MDDKDKELISYLQEDGRISLSEMGTKLGMSHVAVSKRLDKLITKGLVHICAGVNAESLDIKILFIGIETENSIITDRLLAKFKTCPRLIMLAPVTGRYNLFAVMISEDTFSLESILGTCSIRTESGIRKSETWFGNSPVLPEYIHLDLAPNKTGGKKSNCGRICEDCRRYVIDRCVGCPSTDAYKGKLWALPKAKQKKRAKSKS